MNEADEIWNRLKYGVFPGSVIVNFKGNGIAGHFNSGWISDALIVQVRLDGLVQERYIDYSTKDNTVIFTRPPAKGAKIEIEAYGQKD